MEKRNYSSKYIKSLKDDSGKVISDPTLILKEEESFYKNLYTANTSTACQNCSLFDTNIPIINEDEKESCEKNITEEECFASLCDLPNNKSPGSDGFNCEFYKYFWGKIKSFVFNSFQYSFQTGTLSIDQRRAILTLIPKGDKDIRLLKNWRPISLLNLDYKILAKLLAKRLQTVLPSVINEDQSGYIKNRYIGENVRTILDIIELTKDKINPGVILFLDFEKAFDSISWNFLFKTLHAFNFGDIFIYWIKLLYSQPLACVSNNGYATNFFELSRGVRQGCPISSLLFILVAEIMALHIRNNNNIQGIQIKNRDILITQLADDTSLFLRNETSVKHTLDLLNHIHKCAGLKLNRDKTHGMLLGQRNNMKLTKYGINISTTAIKTLGIYVSNNEHDTMTITLNEKVTKIKSLLQMWKGRSLSIKGKITILRSKVLPIILYPASILYVPKKIIDEIDHLFYDFIWPNKKHHVKKQVLKQKIEDGGLKMPCISSMIKSIKMKWIQAISSKQNSFTLSAEANIKIDDLQTWISSKNDISHLNVIPAPFYQQILEYWTEIHSIEPQTSNEIMNEPLWGNKFILVDKRPAHFSDFRNVGITDVKDIMQPNGTFFSKDELNRKFNFNIDIMRFNSIKSAVPKKWITNIRSKPPDLQWRAPIGIQVKINNNYKPLSNVKCKEFYWIFINQNYERSKALETWEELFYYVEFDWEIFHLLPFKCARETSLQSMQFQIINRYFPCGETLNTWYKTNSYSCEHCGECESLQHYFIECPQVRTFWKSFHRWWKSVTSCQFQLSTIDILLGIPNHTAEYLLDCLNFCILFAKNYICNCKRSNVPPFFYQFQVGLKWRLEFEQAVYIMNDSCDKFNAKWDLITNSF